MPPRVRTPAKEALEGEVLASETVEAELASVAEPVTIGSITVMMSKPNDTQMGLLLRLGRAAERNHDLDSVARLFEAYFAIIESLLPVVGDAARLEAEMASGRVTLEAITQAWSENAEEPTPNRRTRRARGK